MLLLPAIYYLLSFNFLNASNGYDVKKQNVTISLHSHKNNCIDDYDITTIYRFNNMYSPIKCSTEQIDSVIYSRAPALICPWALRILGRLCSIEIHSRTNAIGIPLSIDKIIYDNNSTSDNVLQINIDEFYKYGFIQNNSRMNVYFDSNYWERSTIESTGEECEFDYDTSSNPTTNYTEYNLHECIKTLKYKYERHYYPYEANDDIYQTFLTVHWKPIKKQNCISITYLHNLDSDMEIILSIFNENGTIITSPILKKRDSITTLKVDNMALIQDQKYKMSLKRKYGNRHNYYGYNSNFGNWFKLIRITQCSDNDEEEVRVVSMNNIANYWCKPQEPFTYTTPLLHILGNDNTGVCNKTTESSTKSCLNGGFMHSTRLTCVCPPGFKGQFCEIGCGSNYYGADCKGVCSMHNNEMCRGLLMCTQSYGCTCPPGLTGLFCDEDCIPGKYGADCKQTCSSNCYDNKCDQYTGICYQGCSEGYLPPYCLQRYPYLISPPKLLSNDYDNIEMELNFESDNVKGEDKNIKLKYYQIFYKSIIEEKFTKSEIKLINETSNRTTVILHNLEPDTIYIIGVLVITSDGNFNREDIVFNQYKTSCIQPNITDYNIQLISGIKNVSIQWDKINLKRLECNIIEYVLTLTFNQSQNQMTGIEEIKSSSNYSGLTIGNLYPGYNYSIFLTPKTNEGLLISSPTYSFIPLITKNDVIIKDIVATTIDNNIKISWKLVNAYQQDTIVVNAPFTYVVKFKLQRIFSCSLEKLENNWTSIIIFNRTNYEISAIPNSQYCIQVTVANDDLNSQRVSQIYALTPASSPQTEPIFDLEYPMYVTNDSVFIQWKIDPVNCSKLNGFLSTFYIELKDMVDGTLEIIETKQNYLYTNKLKSNNYYEIKVFIKTHIGYNLEHYLFTNFTTKTRYLAPVEDLVVYKKSLKYQLVGLRWYYLEDANLDGFIVSINQNAFGKANNISIIAPTKCSAWPEYYCHTFHNLSPIHNFTFKIKPKSFDYPEGGHESSISFNLNDELPDSPNNLKIIDIGNTFMTLQWDIPWIFNGLLKMYIINVEEISYEDINLYSGIRTTELPINEELPSYNYTVKDLNPGSTYSIGILSVSTSLWYSFPIKIQAKTLLGN
ncbi:hypothetical protein QTP88_027571 [Uroleucon formosanum]